MRIFKKCKFIFKIIFTRISSSNFFALNQVFRWHIEEWFVESLDRIEGENSP